MLVPEQSQYDYLANLPESIRICEALNTVMRLIEEAYTDFAGILPKNYQEMDEGLLRNLCDGTHESPKEVEEGFKLVTGKHIYMALSTSIQLIQ